MATPADYHMHTPLCRHAVGEPSEYAARAVSLGLAEIGFTDHNPMRHDDFDDWRMRLDQLDDYIRKVDRARQEHPQLSIKIGLEVDFIPGFEDWIRELAARHSWDYFIGSVHYVSESWDLDNPQKISQWRARPAIEVWTAYFERLTLAAQSGLFEIIGHADLCKKFCFYPEESCLHLFENFLSAAAAADVAIELNTAGLRKDCREIYPSRQILERAFQKQVPITFGSDAHAPDEVGHAFRQAIELAQSVGYTHWRRFAQRKFQMVAIT